MASQAGPGSPQHAAVAWLDAVMGRHDLAAAWPATDPQLRLVLAQDWVWTHRHDPAIGHDRDWDEIARGLAASPPDHALWPRFASDLVTMWQRTWKGFDPRTWHVRPEPEVLGLDLEVVTFVDKESSLTRRFAMAHRRDVQATQAGDVQATQAGDAQATQAGATQAGDGTWLVAGVNGEQIFEPGWPPKMGRSTMQP